jgi:hypothetical protein
MEILPVSDTRGANWTPANLKTIINWINFAAFMIEGLDESINIFRGKIRFNTILGLILSTASGTISVAQYSEYVKSTSIVSLTLNSIFTLFTFSIAINTGYIKIYQIQERLELFIKTKQEWTSFVSNLAAELDLPIAMRKDAVQLISNYREHYLNLMNVDYEMHSDVLKSIKDKMELQITKQEKKQRVVQEENFKTGQLNIIRKTHGLKVYDMAISEVESMIEFLNNLYKLDSYRHDKDIKDIIKGDEVKFMQHAYGKMPIHVPVQVPMQYVNTQTPNTLTRVVVDTQNTLFKNEKLDTLYESLESYILERNILEHNRRIFLDELIEKGVDMTTYDNSDAAYKSIELFNESIKAYEPLFTHACEEITYSTNYMDYLYEKYKNIHELINNYKIPKTESGAYHDTYHNTYHDTSLDKLHIQYRYLETILEIGSRKRKETFKKIYGEIMARKSSNE